VPRLRYSGYIRFDGLAGFIRALASDRLRSEATRHESSPVTLNAAKDITKSELACAQLQISLK